MAERCRYAYRIRGKAAVMCKQIKGDMNFCGHQYLCGVTHRWEVNKAAPCTLRDKPPVNKEQ